jgi:hypothetical protein
MALHTYYMIFVVTFLVQVHPCGEASGNLGCRCDTTWPSKYWNHSKNWHMNPCFRNGELVDKYNMMYGDLAYTFGCLTAQRQVT